MSGTAFGTVLVPAALMLLMLALGLSLEIGDFRRVLGSP
jgi:predicted Na+-dependent transporter